MTQQLNLLIVGQGGREHALAWKLAQSPRAARVWVAPGTGGTAAMAGKVANVSIAENDFAALINFARREMIGLTVVGPEALLAAGIVDAFQTAGLRCFGPTAAAAQLESSKALAKAFMARCHIPTGRYAVFSDYAQALDQLRRVDYEVVIKASGLAAGKGVVVPHSFEEAAGALRQMMTERAFGPAGEEVVVEERLYGQEASVLAFCDGQTVIPMPPAQDHKAIFDGDQGPNTGGMGAYAPTPLVTPALSDRITQTILQPAVAGLRAEGRPFVGILYAGLMLTEAGPQVLEFNCRFGDPEAQVILPLLESDLVDILEAALDRTLDRVEVRWRPGAAAAVVAASEGYPGNYLTGQKINGLSEASALAGVVVFHAGTKRLEDGSLVASGGRVLAVAGLGDDLRQAVSRAYQGLAQIDFQGMYFRRDIGTKAFIAAQR